MRGFLLGVRALYGLVGCFALYLIWDRLDILRMDLAGHMASGMWFLRGYFHSFQENNFLGYVHGLFYPPLEDAILAVFHLVLPGNPLVAFKLYLSVLASVPPVGLFSPGGALVFRLGALAIFLLPKSGSMAFQGLSLHDLVVTGLSSEFLGALFLFGMLRLSLHCPEQGPQEVSVRTGLRPD